MPRAKKNPEQCKAKDPDTKRRCTRKADDTGYCTQCKKLHHQTGPKTAEGKKRVYDAVRKANTTHGIYAKVFTEEEKEWLEEGESQRETLYSELGLCRVQLKRCTEKIEQILAGDLKPGDPWEEGESTEESEYVTEEVAAETPEETNKGRKKPRRQKVPTKRKEVRRVPALRWFIELGDRLINRIQSLVGDIVKNNLERPDDDPNVIAREIQIAMKTMRSATGGDIGQSVFNDSAD